MIAWKVRSEDPAVASFRYRCLAPIEALRRRGLPAGLFRADDVRTYRAVVFSKVYGEDEQRLADELRGRRVRVLLDLCDNHFFNPFGLENYRQAGRNLRAMIARVDQVVCSTETLASVVREEAAPARPPAVVGDAVEIPSAPAAPDETGLPRLLWFGFHGSPNAPCGMGDLANVAPLLRDIARRHPFELVVASNSAEKYKSVVEPLGLPSRYVAWDLASFPRLLAGSRAVLIPISRNPFTLCKTNNRLATALAAGIPVVADRIPSYDEFAPFCHLDDWERGLTEVLTRPREARARAAAARDLLVTRWSPEAILRQWLTVLDVRAEAALNRSEA